jgi:hypothetical protein
VTDPCEHGHVVDHTPHAHTPVRRGQLVTLLIGQADDLLHCAPAVGGPELGLANNRSESAPDDDRGTAPVTSADSEAAELGGCEELDEVGSAEPVPARVPAPVRAIAPGGLSEREERPREASHPSMPARRWLRGRRVSGRWLAALAVAAAAVVLVGAVSSRPGGHRLVARSAPNLYRHPVPAQRAQPRAAVAVRSPTRRRGHAPHKQRVRRSRRTRPRSVPGRANTTSTPVLSSTPVQRPVRLPGVAAPAERSSTATLPPSPTGPLPGPYPNQP